MDQFVEFTAEVVANYVGNQHINANEIPNLIETTYQAFRDVGIAASSPQAEPEVQQRRRRRAKPQPEVAALETRDIDESEPETAQASGWAEDEDGNKVPPQPMFD